MNEYRPISAESQHNFHFLPHFNSKTTEPIFTIFTRSRAIRGAINACIHKTIVHFVSEYESEEWFNFDVGKNRPKLIGTIATSLGLLQNLYQFYNLHACLYYIWNVGEDWFSSCWDIRWDRPIFAISFQKYKFLTPQSLALLDQSSPYLYAL